MPERERRDGRRSGEIEIVSRRLQDGIVIEVRGEVDLATAPTVEHELLRAEQSHDLVALDLSGTSFMDSTGLHMIIAADRRLRERGGRLVVVPGPPQIRRLLNLTGVGDRLELIDDAAELGRAIAAERTAQERCHGSPRIGESAVERQTAPELEGEPEAVT